jgi:hypothetical protein
MGPATAKMGLGYGLYKAVFLLFYPKNRASGQVFVKKFSQQGRNSPITNLPSI